MLDSKLIRSNPEAVAEKLRVKGFELDVAGFKALEEERKVTQTKAENLQKKVTLGLKALVKLRPPVKTSSRCCKKWAT